MRTNRSTPFRLFALAFGVAAGLTVAGAVHAGRNSAGTFSLASGNPVVAGTTITPTWANSTLSDIGTELTASLDRNGRGSMLAPLKCVDGTVAAPGLTFGNEPGTGLYRIGASNPAMAVSGVKRQEWTSSGTAVTGTLSTTGAATLNSLGVTSNATVGGTLGVTGATTLSSASVTGNATVGGTLGVTGVATFSAKPVAPATAGGDGSTTLTTKGYVDLRAPIASPTFTGTVTLPATGAGSTEAVRKDYADTALALKAPLAGPTFTGTVTIPTAAVTTLSGTPAFSGKPTASATAGGDGATTLTTKGYVDGVDALKAPLASPTFTGTVTVPTLAVTTVSGTPSFSGKPTAAATDSGDGATTLATKGYVDAWTDSVGTVSWGTHWTDVPAVGGTKVLKHSSGLVVFTFRGRADGVATGTVLTLPAGCRPSFTVYGVALSDAGQAYRFQVASTGAVTIPNPAVSLDYSAVVSFVNGM